MWEAVTAVATLGTGIAIVLTVVLGIRQLRLASAHLAHLQRTSQLEGAMKIFDGLFEHEFIEAMRFVLDDLPSRMLEPEFRARIPLVQHGDDAVHRELVVLRYFERVGVYVKHGLIDGALVYDLMIGRIVEQWKALQDVVGIHRAARGQAFWENFEYLFDNAVRWLNVQERGTNYLKEPGPAHPTAP